VTRVSGCLFVTKSTLPIVYANYFHFVPRYGTLDLKHWELCPLQSVLDPKLKLNISESGLYFASTFSELDCSEAAIC